MRLFINDNNNTNSCNNNNNNNNNDDDDDDDDDNKSNNDNDNNNCIHKTLYSYKTKYLKKYCTTCIHVMRKLCKSFVT